MQKQLLSPMKTGSAGKIILKFIVDRVAALVRVH